jgi:hypothetical protein
MASNYILSEISQNLTNNLAREELGRNRELAN